ncbi:hypothetical protein [Vibrio phage RYC]|nr:hypothetical protein [Vibrio phage RYC]
MGNRFKYLAVWSLIVISFAVVFIPLAGSMLLCWLVSPLTWVVAGQKGKATLENVLVDVPIDWYISYIFEPLDDIQREAYRKEKTKEGL